MDGQTLCVRDVWHSFITTLYCLTAKKHSRHLDNAKHLFKYIYIDFYVYNIWRTTGKLVTVKVGLRVLWFIQASLHWIKLDSSRGKQDCTELFWITWTDWTRLNLGGRHTCVASRLLCFSFSLDLLSDEPLFLLKLPGSLLSQTGNLVETDTNHTIIRTDIPLWSDSQLALSLITDL